MSAKTRMHAHVLGFRDIPKQIRYMILKAYTCNPTHSYIDRAYRVRAMRSLSLSPVPSYGLVRGGFSKSYPVVCVLYVQQSKKVRDRTWSKSPALLRYSYVPFFPLLVVRCLLCCCMCPWGSSTPRHRHHRCYRIHSYVHVLLPTGHGVLNRIASNS